MLLAAATSKICYRFNKRGKKFQAVCIEINLVGEMIGFNIYIYTHTHTHKCSSRRNPNVQFHIQRVQKLTHSWVSLIQLIFSHSVSLDTFCPLVRNTRICGCVYIYTHTHTPIHVFLTSGQKVFKEVGCENISWIKLTHEWVSFWTLWIWKWTFGFLLDEHLFEWVTVSFSRITLNSWWLFRCSLQWKKIIPYVETMYICSFMI